MGDKGYIRLTLQQDRLADKEEGDLIEVYHSETGIHENISMYSKYKDMNAQFQELIRQIEGCPDQVFRLQDAKEAFLAAVTAVEDGNMFSGSKTE